MNLNEAVQQYIDEQIRVELAARETFAEQLLDAEVAGELTAAEASDVFVRFTQRDWVALL